MSVTSPLASLHSVLQTVRASAEANAPLLRKNEAATRAALIDPVLRALGWDTANVQMVEPEKTINTAWRADYALHDVTGKITSLVEAKCLGADLEKFSVVQQLLSYSFGFGVQKIVITDGLNWHFYSEFKPGNSHSSANFHLLQDDTIGCALLLIQWLDAAQSGYGITPKAEDGNNILAGATVTAPAKNVKTATVKSDIVDVPGFIELSQLDLRQLPSQKPKQLRLPDGTVKELKTWKDILVQASLYVLNHTPQIPVPYLDKAGKKTFLFNWQKPAAGIGYKETSLGGQQLYIHTNYNARDCVANAIYALKLAPVAKQKVVPAVAF
jgi:hypothetical protein